MLDYCGKIAGVVICDDTLRYVTALPTGNGLEISDSGEFGIVEADELQFLPLLGCKCVYGINRSQYHRKRLYLAEDLAASDPEQFLWELSRSSADQIDNYLYSLLQLQPTDKGIQIECLSINRKTFGKIGELFEQHRLTLDKMIFEPDATRQCIRPLVADDRAVFLRVEDVYVNLQMYRHGHLVAMEMLRGKSGDFLSAPESVVEEIGILMMSIYGGRPLKRKVTLVVAGDAARESISQLMVKSLPYEFQLLDLPFEKLKITSGILSTQQLHYYFSPLALCYAYNRSQKCASSPEKNAALSLRP